MVLVFVVKGLMFGGVARAFGYANIAPFAVGLGLFQVGEFSFLLARAGIEQGGDLPGDLLARARHGGRHDGPHAPGGQAHARSLRAVPEEVPQGAAAHLQPAGGRARGPRDHRRVRTGRLLRRPVLDRLDKPFVVVEANPARADEARDAGFPRSTATPRPARPRGRRHRRARLVVVTIPDAMAARLAVERAKALAPSADVLVRAESAEQLEDLGRLGVYEAVQPELEAGLELARQALARFGVAAEEAHNFADGVRRELYAPISAEGPAAEDAGDGLFARLRQASRAIEVEWVRLPEGAVHEETTEDGGRRGRPPRAHDRGPRGKERDRGVCSGGRAGGRGDLEPRCWPAARARRRRGRPRHPRATRRLPHDSRGVRPIE